MAQVSRLGKTVLQRTLTYTFQTTKRKIFSEVDTWTTELLLRDVDLPRKDPDFFRTITKAAFFKRFSIKLIEISEVPANATEEEGLRRYAVILPLQTGYKDDVIPLPFILDTGAPDYMYLCRAAVKRLVALNSIKEITTSRFSYQVIGRLLGAGKKFIDHPFASSLPVYYEIHKPHDP